MKAVLHHSASLGDLSSQAAARKNYLRTRNEGSLYQKRGMEGSMRDILAQLPPGPRKPLPKSAQKKQETKDFTQENIKRIRQMSIQKQQSTDETVKRPVRASWADDVKGGDGKVAGRRNNALNKTQVIRREGANGTALVERSKSVQSGLNSRMVEENSESANSKSRTTSLEKATAVSRSGGKNYVQLNKTAGLASAAARRERSSSVTSIRSRSESVDLDQIPKAEPGVLPDYLAGKRQVENQAAAWAIEAKKHGLPTGSHLMPQRERIQLLEDLEAAKRRKEREMFLLPLRSDTLRAQRKREELEHSLREIDHGITVLSKPLVIVQDSLPHPIKVTPPPSSTKPRAETDKKLAQPMERKNRPSWKPSGSGQSEKPAPSSSAIARSTQNGSKKRNP
ncbi:hypothetical protein BV898_17270 [Hypsibius exemplaris]|uniref:Enkurin domain-containing protein n=1 Tax=Hypsibius exemplaris TaxID=2072580 RepID=A0A9X6NEQ7_HYPEX|nr:hypothetical protein BV898_17270 [Hypsibius exemplaris]